ncbi:hypothetical protein INT43_007822 [Umbelopsis isabellina]|uniref:holo-[acyl-carrier-protein] synthase n=1 Tax=Mortierella isabellina TaxID=91625 RepID=A0A8H7PNZ2_MORIS|nr:hypothetical protein INT43_007822 [Umbelopsis isabellina]
MQPLVLLAVNIADWSSKELERGIPCLPAEEQQRVRRYRFEVDRCRSLASQLLRRYLFVKHSKIPWEQLAFETSEFGKPRLANEGFEDIDFNVSHHGDWVVLAACSQGKIGIDVTTRDIPSGSIQDFINCFNSQLADDEIQVLRKIEDMRRKLWLFYEIWCLKESYIKALGLGLHKDLKYVSFVSSKDDLTALRKVQVHDLQAPGNDPVYTFHLSYLDSQHPVAMCTNTDLSDAEDLLESTSLEVDQRQSNNPLTDTSFTKITLDEILQCTD